MAGTVAMVSVVEKIYQGCFLSCIQETTVLDFTRAAWTDDDLDTLSEALCFCAQLRVLILDYNHFTVEGILRMLRNSLHPHTRLSSLQTLKVLSIEGIRLCSTDLRIVYDSCPSLKFVKCRKVPSAGPVGGPIGIGRALHLRPMLIDTE